MNVLSVANVNIRRTCVVHVVTCLCTLTFVELSLLILVQLACDLGQIGCRELFRRKVSAMPGCAQIAH